MKPILLLLLLLPGLCIAQTREKPKLKDFGSSLKKLKWDPEKNATAEVNYGSTTDDDDVITIETSLVVSELLVLDKQNRPVEGLKQSDFLITEEDTPQQVGHFLLGDNRSLPRSIVLIIDYSGSQFPYIKNSVAAASVLVDKLGPYDRMAIVTDDVEVLADFTNDKRELKKKLNTLVEKSKGSDGGFLGLGGIRRQFGKSAQYSALMATLKEAFDDEDQRPIVIFQTDGDEATYLRNSIIVPTVPPDLPPQLVAKVQSEVEQRRELQRNSMTEFSLDDVYRAVEKSRATIYTVVSGAKLIGLTPEQQLATLIAEDERAVNEMLPTLSKKAREAFAASQEARKKVVPIQVLRMRSDENARLQEALAAVAPLSGGWTEFLEQPSQAQGIYTRILSDISQRYIVGYYPTNKERDGKRRRINFEVKGHPEYTILGRRSYYAPGP
ncbi:MAG TPA: VWA domain-containing protein [Pyrinomonadaceae bacterium]|nr:VWA domain-containing protein [Pyrinomonadaceae bacterium]